MRSWAPTRLASHGKEVEALQGRPHRQAAGPRSGHGVRRPPLRGAPFEADLICLRELVPAATAQVRLSEEYGGHEVTIASLRPAAWQAWHQEDGALYAGMQVPVSSTDASRDVARGILAAAEAAPGTTIEATTEPGEGPKLQDILDTDHPFSVRVLETFEYWDLPGDDDEVAAALEQANDSITPDREARLR